MGTIHPLNTKSKKDLSSPDFLAEAPAPAAGELPCDFVYDLRLDGPNSDRFYFEVASLSVRVLAEIDSRASGALAAYTQYVTGVLREELRSRGEYALELLTVGMAMRLYGHVAESTPGWVIDLAREFYSLRRRSQALKPLADFFRAGLFQLFMRRKMRGPHGQVVVHGVEMHHGEPVPGPQPAVAGSEYAGLPRLIEWLQATGEFDQEWRRMDNWRSYWSTLPLEQAATWASVAVELFDWFTGAAGEALGEYTAGVMHFLENTYAMRFWREDQIFCGRLPVEYHMGMVAAEVMNEGLRQDFHSRPRKVLLVPGCLRGVRAQTCKAVENGLDMTCMNCEPDCAIGRITRRMRTEGIEVYVIPHSSGFSRWLERWESDPKVGVAAVACMMNILAGGYEMRARGIASQCVPLDFPGCEKHWRDEPVATGVNEDRLVQIVRSPQ